MQLASAQTVATRRRRTNRPAADRRDALWPAAVAQATSRATHAPLRSSSLLSRPVVLCRDALLQHASAARFRCPSPHAPLPQRSVSSLATATVLSHPMDRAISLRDFQLPASPVLVSRSYVVEGERRQPRLNVTAATAEPSAAALSPSGGESLSPSGGEADEEEVRRDGQATGSVVEGRPEGRLVIMDNPSGPQQPGDRKHTSKQQERLTTQEQRQRQEAQTTQQQNQQTRKQRQQKGQQQQRMELRPGAGSAGGAGNRSAGAGGKEGGGVEQKAAAPEGIRAVVGVGRERRRGGGNSGGRAGRSRGDAQGPKRVPARLKAEPSKQPRLVESIRECSSLGQLLRLYDQACAAVEQQSRTRAEAAGAAAASAGMTAAAAAGLPAPVVWAFLARASELVTEFKAGYQAGQRRRRFMLATRGRSQLTSLVSKACGVVLWSERLQPTKVCLMLSLLVATGRFPGAEQSLGLLVEDSLNTMEAYRSGELALAASSFAKLDYFPGKGWVETLLEATTGRLHLSRPNDLAFTFWALAKWKVALPTAWLQEFYAAYEAFGEKVTEESLPMVCWALGVGFSSVQWAARPPQSFTAHLMLEVQVRLLNMSSQALAHVTWGLCCADVKPPSFWIKEVCQAAQTKLPFATSGLAFSNLMWALACWQRECRPPQELLEVVCDHSARWLASLDSRGLAVLLLALADLDHTPRPEWVAFALETAHRNVPTTDASSAVAILWAVSRFERQRATAAAAAATTGPTAGRLLPRRQRLSSLSPEEQLLLVDAAKQEFGATGSAAGTPPQLRPPRKWLVRYAPLLQDLALVAAGVQPAALAAGEGAARPRLDFEGLDANQMLDLAVALADLYVYPGDEWMLAHETKMVSLLGPPPGAGWGTGPGPGLAVPGQRSPVGLAAGQDPGLGFGPAVGSGLGGGRVGGWAGAGLSQYQYSLLQAAYAALDDTWEGYAAPRAGERY